MKSNRKRKNCMSGYYSVGTKEKVIGHCPPDLTDSVKTALEKEIADFKADPKQAEEVRKDAELSAAGGPSLDAYQEWLAHNEGQEPAEANPDIVDADDGIKYLPSKKDSKSARLLQEFRQSLTPRELQVWNLVMKHQYSQHETAQLLSIKQQVVLIYLKRAKAKFAKFAEAVKRGQK